MEPDTPDVLVVGAGIFGLSVAWAARRRGLSVRVLEAGQVGASASGGIVGALTPHAPSRWRPMMAFQFDALTRLPAHVASLEAETGFDIGYAQTGRLTPLISEKARASAERDVAARTDTWGDRARYEILEHVPEDTLTWIRPEAAPFGIVKDSVSARVDPRAYLKALTTALNGAVVESARVETINATETSVTTPEASYSARAIVLAAGWQVWDLAQHVAPIPAGQPVKGQAAMFAADASGQPVIYQDGLYVIPHAGGRVAVGSTSEKTFDAPFETDELLNDVVDRARAMCPALETAQVLERWAGLRPKPPGREPVVGPLPGVARVWLAAGGFKISFGIAHAVAEAVVDGITGEATAPPVPETFDPSCLMS